MVQGSWIQRKIHHCQLKELHHCSVQIDITVEKTGTQPERMFLQDSHSFFISHMPPFGCFLPHSATSFGESQQPITELASATCSSRFSERYTILQHSFCWRVPPSALGRFIRWHSGQLHWSSYYLRLVVTCDSSMTPLESQAFLTLGIGLLYTVEELSIGIFCYGVFFSLVIYGSFTGLTKGLFVVLFFASVVFFLFVLSFLQIVYFLERPDCTRFYRWRGFSNCVTAAMFAVTIINFLLFTLAIGTTVAILNCWISKTWHDSQHNCASTYCLWYYTYALHFCSNLISIIVIVTLRFCT